MLKRIGAALLAVGLFLPYASESRIITAVWQDARTILFQGVPVLITIAYVLHRFVPPLARFHERNGQALHGVFRVVFFVLVGAYLATALSTERLGWPTRGPVVVALAITGAALYWSQGRATKTARLPLLLLICAGVPTIAVFVDTLRAGALQYGAWVFTAGYAVAVVGEVLGLRPAAKISHGG